MEFMIITTAAVLGTVITLVVITHRRQCRQMREAVKRLESAHRSTVVNIGGQHRAAQGLMRQRRGVRAMGNWSRSINEHGEYDYDWSQDEADAVVYQHEGKWKLSYSMGYDEEWKQQDLPNATSSDSAIKQANPILWTKFYQHVEDQREQPVERDVIAEQTVELRAEVKEAYAAWQADPADTGLEYDYFDKLDRLDINLAERDLQRGDDIDEELPLDRAGWDDLNARLRTHGLVAAYKRGELQARPDDRDELYDLLGGQIVRVTDSSISDDWGEARPEDLAELVRKWEPSHILPSSNDEASVAKADLSDALERDGVTTPDEERVTGGPDPTLWYRGHGDAEGHHQWWGENAQATMWKEDGRWLMHFTLDEGEAIHVDLGKTRFVQRAYDRANRVLDTAQSAEDVRNVVNLANEVEDRTAGEQASLARFQQSLDQSLGGGPGWSR
jgi:hypothetical protein